MPLEPPFTIAQYLPPFLARLAGRIYTPSTTPAGYILMAAGDGTADWAANTGGGAVDSVTAADTSIVVDNTDPVNPTVRTNTLDVIATDHPPAANWSNNSNKITGVTAGAAAGEAATYDQTPAGIVTATGDTLYASAAHTVARLGIGSANQGLQVSGGGIPTWAATATSVLTAAGDILYASAANTLARLAKGSDGQVLTLASGVPSWAAGGGSITSTSATIAAPVTIVNASTFYDGPSVSCVAGTWLVVWQMGFSILTTTAQSNQWCGRLWDGTTTYSEQETSTTPAANQQGFGFPVSGNALITLGSTTTLKISGACSHGSSATQINSDPQFSSSDRKSVV